MAQLGSRTVHLDVGQQPDAPSKRPLHVLLLGTEQGHLGETEGPGTDARRRRRDVAGGGEEHADHVVMGEVVALVEEFEHLDGALRDLLGGIGIDRCGTTKGENTHEREGYRATGLTARCSANSSFASSNRYSPGFRRVSVMGPILVRTNRSTG